MLLTSCTFDKNLYAYEIVNNNSAFPKGLILEIGINLFLCKRFICFVKLIKFIQNKNIKRNNKWRVSMSHYCWVFQAFILVGSADIVNEVNGKIRKYFFQKKKKKLWVFYQLWDVFSSLSTTLRAAHELRLRYERIIKDNFVFSGNLWCEYVVHLVMAPRIIFRGKFLLKIRG